MHRGGVSPPFHVAVAPSGVPIATSRALSPDEICAGFSHASRYLSRAFLPEVAAVDAVYLLILAALYFVTHGLVWALDRLGEPS
jgi:hypothetical protein